MFDRPSFRILAARFTVLLAMAGGPALAQTSCAELEALASDVAASRDTQPADGVERGTAALAATDALQATCPAGTAMLLGGIASNLHILGRNAEAVQHYQQAITALGVISQ